MRREEMLHLECSIFSFQHAGEPPPTEFAGFEARKQTAIQGTMNLRRRFAPISDYNMIRKSA
jgi:hypothetical protein